MIYNPRRAALELRQRILESMTAEELEEYARQTGQPSNPDADIPKGPSLPSARLTMY